MSGIWPPSNPGRTLPPWRAVWPFPPRPAVLPIPEPGPRPLRMRARCEPRGARRSCRARRGYWVVESAASALARDFGFLGVFAFALALGICLLPSAPGRGSGVGLCGHLDEVTHTVQHAAHRRMIGVHNFSLVMLEAQGHERPLGFVRLAAA